MAPAPQPPKAGRNPQQAVEEITETLRRDYLVPTEFLPQQLAAAGRQAEGVLAPDKKRFPAAVLFYQVAEDGRSETVLALDETVRSVKVKNKSMEITHLVDGKLRSDALPVLMVGDRLSVITPVWKKDTLVDISAYDTDGFHDRKLSRLGVGGGGADIKARPGQQITIGTLGVDIFRLIPGEKEEMKDLPVQQLQLVVPGEAIAGKKVRVRFDALTGGKSVDYGKVELTPDRIGKFAILNADGTMNKDTSLANVPLARTGVMPEQKAGVSPELPLKVPGELQPDFKGAPTSEPHMMLGPRR